MDKSLKLVDDEQARIGERERAFHARQIIENPVYQQAKEAVLDEFRGGWEDTAAAQTQEREQIWMMIMIAKKVFAEIEREFQTGKMAQMQLDEMRK